MSITGLAPTHWMIIDTTNVCYECGRWDVVAFHGSREECIEWLTNPINTYSSTDNYLLAEVKDKDE